MGRGHGVPLQFKVLLDRVHRCSKQHYSQQSKGGNKPSVYQWMNGETKCDICLKKEGNSDHVLQHG